MREIALFDLQKQKNWNSRDDDDEYLTETGQVFSFGKNYYGQLGDNSNTNSNIPVAVYSSGVLNGHVITAIAAGDYHSLVLSGLE